MSIDPTPHVFERAYIQGQRPARIYDQERALDIPLPSHYRVFNAPRPIWGHLKWQGEFLSGVFFAAVDSGAWDAAAMLTVNRQMQAVEVSWLDAATMRARLSTFFRLEYGKESKGMIDDLHHDSDLIILRQWYQYLTDLERLNLTGSGWRQRTE